MSVSNIGENLKAVSERIALAAQQADRHRSDISLIAVSKTFPVSCIKAAIAAGQRIFGENRVQEAREKWPALLDTGLDLELHLIGPLQTNKVADAVELFDVIHVLDREKLARKLETVLGSSGFKPRLYIQVNTGEETKKSGVFPKEADDFIAFCRNETGLEITGLTCIPPVDEPAGLHFALLRQIAMRNGLVHLSMGMSGDFETAVRFGATHLRLGSAIFGERSVTPKPV